MIASMPHQRSPVLLLGAGPGEATCGILYLASHLRRGGIEAFVRLTDDDVTDRQVARSLSKLMARVQPKLVGISLKWFHHVARAKVIARALRAIDPEVEIVIGGNSASWWWKELLTWECVDHVVLGDGEVPLLSLARGDAAPPNVVSHSSRAALDYVQSAKVTDVYYSHFDEMFLSQLDLASFSGWVAPGKGCGENCLYCSGTRGMQKATFGRATPFLRPTQSVQRDHREIIPRTWQLRYDFAGSTAAFLSESWGGADLSRHSTTYFLWGVPPQGLEETLSAAFQRVFVVLDIGCFSESQRLDHIQRGVLKPCPTDARLLEVIARARQFPNLELEISGIAGLPYANAQTLEEERALVEKLVEMGCTVGYQRLQAQPGALVTEHPERFGMVSEAKSFDQFLEYFSEAEPGDDSVPMVRYADAGFEKKVQRTADQLHELIWKEAERKKNIELRGNTRLVNAAADTRELPLGEWLGAHNVTPRAANEKVTVVRSIDGNGLACVPSLPRAKFSEATLQQGKEAAALLETLAAFEKPARIDAVKARRDVVEYLVAGKFLRPI
jgi:hypothetical protein